MTVLVTGATGFAGRHLVRELIGRGLSVVPTGLFGDELRKERGPAAGLEVPTPAPGPRPLDVRDGPAVRAMFATVRPDAVIHLAGQSSAAASFQDPAATLEVNVLGTWHVLEAVRAEVPRARTLVISSADLYGPSTPATPHRETAAMNPKSPYGASKAAQDLLAGLTAQAYGLDLVRVRPFSHAGPGQHPRFALPAFAAQIAAIERGDREPMLQVGDVSVVRDYTDVRDVVRAYADLLTLGQAGEAYNVCRGRGLALRELLERLCAAAQVPIRIEVNPARLRPSDLPHLVGVPEKVAGATGFQPKIEIEQTLADLLAEARSDAPGELGQDDQRIRGGGGSAGRGSGGR
jgi:GDP-4-dehydro-6-deoxy-D-mannose reductase